MNLKPVCLLVLGLLVSSRFTGERQTLRQYHPDKSQPTEYALCDDVKPEPNKPRIIRGPMLISADVLHQAYAIATVELPDDREDDNDCRNRSTLFVASEKNGRFEPVLDVPGADETRGNGLELIDWSLGSQLLLADLLTWRYGGEGWEHNVVLYSARTGVLKQQSMSALFTKHRAGGCTFDGEILGFLSDGRVAIREFPFTQDEIEEFHFCGGSKEAYWALNPSTFQLAKISGEQALTINGHFEQPK